MEQFVRKLEKNLEDAVKGLTPQEVLCTVLVIRDLSEMSREGGGGRILSLGSKMRWPIPTMGVKFANPPFEPGLKYHDPPPLYKW